MKAEEDWYKRAFNADYSNIYSHRDDHSAASEVAWATAKLGTTLQEPILDLCCGNGRHTEALIAQGHNVHSLDLSIPLLIQAASRKVKSPQFTCADMRALPFAGETFGAVFSFFTSFGYFQADSENTIVVREIARVLRPGGVVFFDFLNADYVKKTLVPFSRDEKDGSLLIQERSITADGKRVEKQITFSRPNQSNECYTESVRLFTQSELCHIFDQAGLTVQKVFGGFDGRAFDEDSPRLLCFSQKMGA